MTNISEKEMKKLIEIADKARLRRDWYTSFVTLLCLLEVLLVGLGLIVIMFNPAKFSLEQLQMFVEFFGIGIACVALVVAAFSFYKKPFEVQIIDSVEKEFQWLSKNVKESKKILLRALIAMKIKQPNVSLKELFNLYPSMFDEETIVRQMYS